MVGNWENNEYDREIRREYSEYDNLYLFDPIYHFGIMQYLSSPLYICSRPLCRWQRKEYAAGMLYQELLRAFLINFIKSLSASQSEGADATSCGVKQ